MFVLVRVRSGEKQINNSNKNIEAVVSRVSMLSLFCFLSIGLGVTLGLGGTSLFFGDLFSLNLPPRHDPSKYLDPCQTNPPGQFLRQGIDAEPDSIVRDDNNNQRKGMTMNAIFAQIVALLGSDATVIELEGSFITVSLTNPSNDRAYNRVWEIGEEFGNIHGITLVIR